MLEKGLQLKTNIFFLWLVKYLKNLCNRLVDHIQKFGLFSDIQYDFGSFQSTAGLLTVLSDKIAWALNRSGATQVIAFDISKAFDTVWHAQLLHKIKSSGILGQIFILILCFPSNRQLWLVLDGKSSKEYPVDSGVLEALFLVQIFSYYTLMTLLMMLSVILLSMRMIPLSIQSVIRYLICGNN